MIHRRTAIQMNQQRQELQLLEHPFFPLLANAGDIRGFFTGCIPSHWHRELEIFELVEGSVQIGIGERTITLHAGDGCFINSGILHSFASALPQPCLYRSFVVDPTLITGMPGSVFDTTYLRPLIEQGPPFLTFDSSDANAVFFDTFHTAFSACEREDFGYEFQARAALSSLLLFVLQISKVAPAARMSAVSETRLKRMLAWIDQHIEEPIAVKHIADAANVCPRECQRMFRRYLHSSPVEYVLRRRIFFAANLLTTTDHSVTDIALACGFSSPAYFTKKFHEIAGAAPLAYRKAAE